MMSIANDPNSEGNPFPAKIPSASREVIGSCTAEKEMRIIFKCEK
jgi:hypothetical protein